MKYTLGEKLGVLPAKPVDCTSTRYAGRVHRKPCGCGRGWIEYEYVQGSRIARHQVWDEGFDFGRPSFADCCEQCAREDEERTARELAEQYDD